MEVILKSAFASAKAPAVGKGSHPNDRKRTGREAGASWEGPFSSAGGSADFAGLAAARSPPD